MNTGIFLSYRRADARHVAGRLASDLERELGKVKVFRDVEDIAPGLDFTEVLQGALDTCAVMLVLIGPKWLNITDDDGHRRLDNPGDWVRTEIANGLKKNVRVVPVLIEGTRLPKESELPDDLKALSRRQAISLSDDRWRGDVEKLVTVLRTIPGLEDKAGNQRFPKARLAVAAMAVVLAGLAGLYVVGQSGLQTMTVKEGVTLPVTSEAGAVAPSEQDSSAAAKAVQEQIAKREAEQERIEKLQAEQDRLAAIKKAAERAKWELENPAALWCGIECDGSATCYHGRCVGEARLSHNVDRDKDKPDIPECPPGYQHKGWKKDPQAWPAADVYSRVCTRQ